MLRTFITSIQSIYREGGFFVKTVSKPRSPSFDLVCPDRRVFAERGVSPTKRVKVHTEESGVRIITSSKSGLRGLPMVKLGVRKGNLPKHALAVDIQRLHGIQRVSLLVKVLMK